LDSYKAYLLNVRQQDSTGGPGASVVKLGGKEKSQKIKVLGPYKFTHTYLEKDGIIAETSVPENRCVTLFYKDKTF